MSYLDLLNEPLPADDGEIGMLGEGGSGLVFGSLKLHYILLIEDYA